MKGRGRNIGTNKTPQDVFNICNIWSVKVVRSIKERSAEKFWTCKTLSVPQPPIKILHQLLNLFTFCFDCFMTRQRESEFFFVANLLEKLPIIRLSLSLAAERLSQPNAMDIGKLLLSGRQSRAKTNTLLLCENSMQGFFWLVALVM